MFHFFVEKLHGAMLFKRVLSTAPTSRSRNRNCDPLNKRFCRWLAKSRQPVGMSLYTHCTRVVASRKLSISTPKKACHLRCWACWSFWAAIAEHSWKHRLSVACSGLRPSWTRGSLYDDVGEWLLHLKVSLLSCLSCFAQLHCNFSRLLIKCNLYFSLPARTRQHVTRSSVAGATHLTVYVLAVVQNTSGHDSVCHLNGYGESQHHLV